MFIPKEFWFPNLRTLSDPPRIDTNDLSIKIEAEEYDIISPNQKRYLISSDTYNTPNENDAMWRRVNRVFKNACHWVLNTQSNRYHIVARLSDFYQSDVNFFQKVEYLLPQKPQEEFIRENFKHYTQLQNINKLRDTWLPLETKFTNTLLSLRNLSLDRINPNDIRLYINFLKKLNSGRPHPILHLKLQNNLISLINGIVSNSKTSAKLIFSGSFSSIPSCMDNIFLPEALCMELAFHDTDEIWMAYENYKQYHPFLVIRDQVFNQRLVQIKKSFDEQHTITHFPTDISDLVTSYVHTNLETFMLEATPKELELFVSDCMAWLKTLENMDKLLILLIILQIKEGQNNANI